MPKSKSASAASDKWARVTPTSSQSYAEGVANPRRDWAQATTAGAQAYKDGVAKAAAEGRFEKGVSRAGTAKWQNKAVELGATRFGTGVQAARSAYEAGVAPFLRVIESTDIGPRYAKGDPRNIQRVSKIAAALHSAKTK